MAGIVRQCGHPKSTTASTIFLYHDTRPHHATYPAPLLVCFSTLSRRKLPSNGRSTISTGPLPPVITPGTASTQDTGGHSRLPTRSCSSTAKIFRSGSTGTASPRSGRWRTATWKWSPRRETFPRETAFGDCQLHVEFAEPTPAVGREPGARQQRRLSDGPLRDPGARLLREQDLRRRPGRGRLRTVSAAGQRRASARDSGRPYDIIFHRPRI